ncbi:hypothetical protein GGTG_13818 [Gaeumannomyces tritici R3-111a-1]|uniref:Uncharacterized protein n=1 Tax=Gaeumannomyces tritici (strain R3-111a-1) TaxID=644352 RepID=J3PJX7_GAET3|nr:hypothetical protein GGTG_13818 [Gaeumannomyces tritici R3-111a-1]EJT68607.1 hypothetical protein GGTG_13818 [Gaeumannomyces tritici R3-111a-1]
MGRPRDPERLVLEISRKATCPSTSVTCVETLELELAARLLHPRRPSLFPSTECLAVAAAGRHNPVAGASPQ